MREYRGYCEWAVHPLEAEFLLARGYALVDGQRRRVELIHTEEHVVQILVEGSDPAFMTDLLPAVWAVAS